ncbi:MAG: EscU/YscU/HrcU family type III secretion system export apparatus switch protein [Gammaproteobacteria bacterium]|nr:EscU/YscU/HrcU family type III secretion system export apparatus switch protein [Gammaproteobacteria bacterium]
MTTSEHSSPKKVVGLKYEMGEGLPTVVVKASGNAVDEVLRARSLVNGPPVVQDAQLADQLYRLPMDGHIGPELFQLVAALLAHVFAIEEAEKRKGNA